MSAKGIFTTGFTIEEVEAIQAKAKAMLLEGKATMSWSDSGTSVSKQLVMPVAEILEECSYALKRLAPEKYSSRTTNTDTPPTSVVAWRLPQ